MINNKGNILGF